MLDIATTVCAEGGSQGVVRTNLVSTSRSQECVVSTYETE